MKVNAQSTASMHAMEDASSTAASPAPATAGPQARSRLDDLPREIQGEIFGYLGPKDMLNLSKTSDAMKEMFDAPWIQAEFAQRSSGAIETLLTVPPQQRTAQHLVDAGVLPDAWQSTGLTDDHIKFLLSDSVLDAVRGHTAVGLPVDVDRLATLPAQDLLFDIAYDNALASSEGLKARVDDLVCCHVLSQKMLDDLLFDARSNPTHLSLLLDHGADMYAYSQVPGNTILHELGSTNLADRILIADILLDHGFDINTQDKVGVTALHRLASRAGRLSENDAADTAFLKHLIDKGANPLLKDDAGMTALDYYLEANEAAVSQPVRSHYPMAQQEQRHFANVLLAHAENDAPPHS